MGSLTVTADRIVRQAANTIPGNATGAEAACQSLTPSQVRTFLGMATTSDVTFDIVRATTSVQTPLVNNASAALTLGNSTYGVTVPGAATFSGDISMQKTSAQGYIRAYSTGGVRNTRFYHDSSNGWIESSYGDLVLNSADGDVYAFKSGINSTLAAYDLNGAKFVKLDPTTVAAVVGSTDLYCQATSGVVVLQGSAGVVQVFKSGSNAKVEVYNSNLSKYTTLTHDSTNGILSTSAGNLNIAPAGGTVAVTGGITASGIFSLTANYQDLADGVNIVCGTTTGTKLSTGATQKLSFWGVTPVVQPASANQAALSLDSDVTGGDTVDKGAVDANFAAIQTLVNQLRSDLVAAGIIKGAA